MGKIKVKIVDKLTFAEIDSTEVYVDDLKEIIVLTSDLETTEVVLVGHEDE